TAMHASKSLMTNLQPEMGNYCRESRRAILRRAYSLADRLHFKLERNPADGCPTDRPEDESRATENHNGALAPALRLGGRLLDQRGRNRNQRRWGLRHDYWWSGRRAAVAARFATTARGHLFATAALDLETQATGQQRTHNNRHPHTGPRSLTHQLSPSDSER